MLVACHVDPNMGSLVAWALLALLVKQLILIIYVSVTLDYDRVPSNRPPEDAQFLLRHKSETIQNEYKTKVTPEYSIVTRGNKVYANDAENHPIFIGLLIATAVFGNQNIKGRLFMYVISYIGARYLFAFFYIFGIQPGRSLSWWASVITSLSCSMI